MFGEQWGMSMSFKTGIASDSAMPSLSIFHRENMHLWTGRYGPGCSLPDASKRMVKILEVA